MRKRTWLRRSIVVAAVLVVLFVAYFGVMFFRARSAFNKHEIVDPGATGRRVHETGVFANYFPAPRPGRRPALLLLGGSEGGIGKGTNEAAETLQREGFSVLAPSYFGGPGEPKDLVGVPLETFDRALDWLRAQPEVDPHRIAIGGVSKGAEAALLVATRHPELRGVIAGVPSSVVWPGIKFGNLKAPSSWTLDRRPLPFVPYGPFKPRILLGDVGVVYRDGIKKLPEHPDAAIPIERIKAPVLLVCGESDKLWPSCVMSRQLEARAESKGGPRVELLAYENAGHLCVGPPVAKDDPDYKHLAFLGGTIEGNNAARTDSWPKILAFARAVLAQRP